MAEGKWINGLNAEMPADEAAIRVLTVRFKAVAAALPRAIEAPDEIEHVHQLRVATRRAAAAVRIFGSLLPKKVRQNARDLLRGLRRSAGEARNWDVYLDSLDQSAALQGFADTINFLAGLAFRERDVAQVLLAGVAAERQAELAAAWQELPRQVRSGAGPSMAELGKTVVAELAGKVHQRILAAPATAEDRHRLRIACKRLRYALEIFAACLDRFYSDTLVPLVSQLQESLGILQDSHVLMTRMTRLLSSMKPLRPDLHSKHRPAIVAWIKESRRRGSAELRALRSRLREWKKLASREPLADVVLVPALRNGQAG